VTARLRRALQGAAGVRFSLPRPRQGLARRGAHLRRDPLGAGAVPAAAEPDAQQPDEHGVPPHRQRPTRSSCRSPRDAMT